MEVRDTAALGYGSPWAWQGHKVEGAWDPAEGHLLDIPIELIAHKLRISFYYTKTLSFLITSFNVTNTVLLEYGARKLGLSYSPPSAQDLVHFLTQ